MKVKSGYRWGDHGHVYPTREGAERQAAAAHANGFQGDAACMPPLLHSKDAEKHPEILTNAQGQEYAKFNSPLLHTRQDVLHK